MLIYEGNISYFKANATKLSKTKIFYKCPKCLKIQNHGNETQKLDNFNTWRIAHCCNENVKIIINDETTRLK
jgi:hypothetical protein